LKNAFALHRRLRFGQTLSTASIASIAA